MRSEITVGSILMQSGTVLPPSLVIESVPYSTGWVSVQNLSPQQLDGKISKAGWTFFYMADRFKGQGFSFNKEKSVGKAVMRVIGKLSPRNCNCLEITEVTMKSFLTIPYATVLAHPRHIQESTRLTMERLRS